MITKTNENSDETTENAPDITEIMDAIKMRIDVPESPYMTSSPITYTVIETVYGEIYKFPHKEITRIII